jgi:hypothetical protein
MSQPAPDASKISLVLADVDGTLVTAENRRSSEPPSDDWLPPAKSTVSSDEDRELAFANI